MQSIARGSSIIAITATEASCGAMWSAMRGRAEAAGARGVGKPPRAAAITGQRGDLRGRARGCPHAAPERPRRRSPAPAGYAPAQRPAPRRRSRLARQAARIRSVVSGLNGACSSSITTNSKPSCARISAAWVAASSGRCRTGARHPATRRRNGRAAVSMTTSPPLCVTLCVTDNCLRNMARRFARLSSPRAPPGPGFRRGRRGCRESVGIRAKPASRRDAGAADAGRRWPRSREPVGVTDLAEALGTTKTRMLRHLRTWCNRAMSRSRPAGALPGRDAAGHAGPAGRREHRSVGRRAAASARPARPAGPVLRAQPDGARRRANRAGAVRPLADRDRGQAGLAPRLPQLGAGQGHAGLCRSRVPRPGAGRAADPHHARNDDRSACGCRPNWRRSARAAGRWRRTNRRWG